MSTYIVPHMALGAQVDSDMSSLQVYHLLTLHSPFKNEVVVIVTQRCISLLYIYFKTNKEY
jgi:hypothetical protein